MARGQGCADAVSPRREERGEGLLEVERDRQVVRRDIRRGDQIIANGTGCGELGVGPELPGEVHVPGIQGLAVRPLQVGAQVERPGLEISADAAVRSSRNDGRY